MPPSVIAAVEPTRAERDEARPGDLIVAAPDVVMDRAFTVPGPPEVVWPWLLQLGKGRAGWYLPRSLERFVPRRRRAARRIEARWLNLVVGDVIPDYGGPRETFTVAEIDAPTSLVYRSRRRAITVTWAITLRPVETDGPAQTRVLLRLRLAPVKRVWLARTAGGALDLLTIAGLAFGLRERLAETAVSGPT